MYHILKQDPCARRATGFVPGHPAIRPYLITTDPMVPTFHAEDVIRWILAYKLGALRTKERFTAADFTVAFMTHAEAGQMLRTDINLGPEPTNQLVWIAQIQGDWQSALTMSGAPLTYSTVPYCLHIFHGKTGNHLHQCWGREQLFK